MVLNFDAGHFREVHRDSAVGALFHRFGEICHAESAFSERDGGGDFVAEESEGAAVGVLQQFLMRFVIHGSRVGGAAGVGGGGGGEL